MKTRDLILVVLFAIVMGACADNMMQNEPAQEFALSRSGETTSSGEYTVTSEMVCKYINITHKGRRINSLTPIVQNGDSLAYVAQYADSLGWELISGDRRVEPVLAFADNGVLNYSDTENPAVNAIHGMINIVKTAKESSDTLKNNIWAFLEPKINRNSNQIKPRANGTGKWIVTDTIYENDSYLKQHMIKTKWHQDNPWNVLCPMINQTYTKAGCVPIATSQVILYFRANNNRDILIPSNAICSPYDGTVNFIDYTTTSWSKMVKTEADTSNYQYTQAFISYIGYLLGTEYGANESSVVQGKELDVIADFKLTGTKVNTYNYNQVIYSLNSNSPVIISCENTQTKNHLFIIDSYRTITENIYIQYTWDPNAELEDWETPQPEPAYTDKDGYARRTELIGTNISTSISMNWGYKNASDIYYSAYHYQSAINYGDYYIPERTIVYDPNWSVTADNYNALYNSFNYMIYNIIETE